jgi:hypothetical protein
MCLLSYNKKLRISLYLFTYLLLAGTSLSAQTDPYALSPKWYFGNKAGIDFSGGGPILLTDGKVNGAGQEGSSSICDPSKNLVFYTDSYRLYDANHSFLQTLNGGTSSTQSSVIVPDPADPANKYYLFTANVDDNGSGDKPASNSNLGIHYYHIQKSSGSILVLSGPIKIADHSEVSEQLSTGTDDNGNYWIVTHEGGHFDWQMNNFWSWKVSSTGVGAKVISSVAGNTGNNPWQGSIKINKCQTRLGAVFSTGVVEIYDWDASTGKVTNMIRRVTGLSPLYGCEFSPDGTILYFTSHSNNILYQLDIASGTVYTEPTWNSSNNKAEMGTLQLGPDNKIYVVNASNFASPCYLGIVNNPNIAGTGCNYDRTGFILNNGSGSYPNVQRGISNIAWLNPQGSLNVVNNNCPSYTFNYSLKNYFGENITMVPNSEEWDFGDGNGFQSGLGTSPVHSYSATGSYNVKIRAKDMTCNKNWTYNTQVNPGCAALPVQWLYTKITSQENSVKISWTTTSENNNHYFVIEKSEDGIHFKSIGLIEPLNNLPQTISDYTFDDSELSYGLCYYRIKQVDKDGSSSSSEILSIENNIVGISIQPNPSEDHFTLTYRPETIVNISVYDLAGREILSVESNAILNFGENFPKGIYLVKVTSGSKIFCKKIVKNN